MRKSRLAVVGFGNVSQGMTRLLEDQGQFLAQKFGVVFEIVAVCDLKLGSLMDPNGLPAKQLLAAAEDRSLTRVPASAYGLSVEQMIAGTNADTLVEASYTDLETGEPARGYIHQALARGMHVVTTNKGPIALHLPELQALAAASQVVLAFEGTVMSGTPALALARDFLTAAGITRIQGILNGTTNFILTQMESGAGYAAALAEAQARGYAEADPTGDMEGYDAAGKVVILGNLLMDAGLRLSDVHRQGISAVRPADIQAAKAEGARWKLIGRIERLEAGVTASVMPTKIPAEHPLASVSGALNAITFTTLALGEVTLIGPGAGRQETGYALVNDLLSIHGEHHFSGV